MRKLSFPRSDLLAIAALTLFVILFFWPVLTHQAWLPHGGGDLASFLYPMYRFAAQSLWSGQLPLWNPYLYAGTPFIADNQSGLFYPPNLLLFLLNPHFSYRALQLLVVGHIWLAGSNMYLLLRRYQPFPPLVALFGSTAFMFSGLFVAHIGNLNLIAVAAWLPLVFLLFHHAVYASQPIPYALGSGVVLGVATLAGHGQMTFLLAAYLGCYGLYVTAVKRHPRPLLLLALAGITAIAVAALSLLPALEGVRYTVRGSFSSGQASSYSLPLRGLVGLLAPDFYGRGAVRFWGDWERVEYGYVGVATLLLAAVGTVKGLRQVEWKRPLFFLLTALLFLLLALGDNAPLYPLLLRLFPSFPFQVPARFVLLLDFSLILLACYGLHALSKASWSPWEQTGWLVAAIIFTGQQIAGLWRLYATLAPGYEQRQAQMSGAIWLFTGLALLGWGVINGRLRHALTPRQTSLLLVSLLAIDLISLGRNVEIEANNPVSGFVEVSPALTFLQADPGLHRIDIAASAWQPSLPQINGQYAIRGVFNPLDLSNYAVYIGSVGYRGSPLYNLLGVKYVIGGKGEPPGDTNFIVPVFDTDPAVTIYLNTRALPRALLLHNAQTVGNDDAAFTAVHSDSFDPTHTVIVKNGPPLTQTPTPGSIEIIRYDRNRSQFRVTTDQPAYFLLSDIYHPDWQVTVNGVASELYAANYALRAVYLEPGSHDIVFTFSPLSWRIGLTISAIAWLLLLLYFGHHFIAR